LISMALKLAKIKKGREKNMEKALKKVFEEM
jgi:hypothetical protein